ncbi:hypothetical protein [Citrobacter sp. Cc139]|uniref:hypothetical protein n=1 Tax=Citrobacter sp. Cc139 TaxID=2985037 RepID=UPI002577E644|nr:hypothetical protein [Citrobacter sp. Cc139]MDM3295866.1 hypothetical protein [Citrobacter sp. Cc139]
MSVTRYDVNGPSSVFEDVNGSLVDFKDYAALEAKRAALAAELKQSKIDADCYKKGMEASNARLVQLAAENAGLKAAIPPLKIINDVTDSWDDVSLAEEIGFNYAVSTILKSLPETPDTDAFLAEVRAQGVEEFLRGSQLPYQIATVLADYDNVDDATLQTVIWSGQPPEPDGDVWHLEYVSRGNAIVHAVLKELRKGVQSWAS